MTPSVFSAVAGNDQRGRNPNRDRKPSAQFHGLLHCKRPCLSDKYHLHLRFRRVKYTRQKAQRPSLKRLFGGVKRIPLLGPWGFVGSTKRGAGPGRGGRRGCHPAAKSVPKGWRNSKQLSAEAREELALAIRECSVVGVGLATPEEIDRINILQATYLAMRRAFDGLSARPVAALIDGNQAPDLPLPDSR